MKISKLKYLAWVFLALIVSSGITNGQNRKMDKTSAGNANEVNIINNISGLTAQQKEQISQMQNGYQLVMNDLRTQMQNTTDVNQQSALRNEMQEITQSHQNTVKRVLTPSQQKEYNKLLAENRTTNASQGKGKGQGKGSGNMRGGGQGRRY